MFGDFSDVLPQDGWMDDGVRIEISVMLYLETGRGRWIGNYDRIRILLMFCLGIDRKLAG